MNRLTNRIDDNVYYTKGKYNPTTLCVEMESWEVRECIKKLAEYEDTELSPQEIIELKKCLKRANIINHDNLEEIEQLIKDIKTVQKTNEILEGDIFNSESNLEKMTNLYEESQAQIRDLVREIEIDRKILNKLECTCDEDNDFTCKRCSRIWELNALLKGIYLERAKGVE